MPPDAYYHDAAIWADAAGITTGCDDGTKFCPDDNLTRAHMITFLKRYEDWTQNSRPYPNTEGAGAGLACLTSEQGCDVALDALGIEANRVLIVGVDIAPGNWYVPRRSYGCSGYAVLNDGIKTHPSYPGPSQGWNDWRSDLRSLPDHGYRAFSHIWQDGLSVTVEPTYFAFIYDRWSNGGFSDCRG